jgi:hypothetical protein
MLRTVILQAKRPLQLPTMTVVSGCSEAGRDGFWLHRLLGQHGVQNVGVDACRSTVECRARWAKTARLDIQKLLAMELSNQEDPGCGTGSTGRSETRGTSRFLPPSMRLEFFENFRLFLLVLLFGDQPLLEERFQRLQSRFYTRRH